MLARDSILLALATGLLGAGAGYFVASAFQGAHVAEASSPRVAAPTSAAAPSFKSTETTVELAQASAERATAVAPAEPPPASVPEAKLERALDAVSAPRLEPDHGAGIISGLALDAGANPLPGVVVVAQRQGGSTSRDPAEVGAGPPGEDDLEDVLRERAQSWAEARAGRRTATTGQDGRFQLEGIRVGANYTVSAHLDGFVLEGQGARHGMGAGDHVQFRAEAVHSIPVSIVGADGSVPREAAVGVMRGDDHTTFAWSPASPNLRLTSGRVAVRGHLGVNPNSSFRGGVDSSHASEEVELDVSAQAGVPLELVLEPRRGIRGRVVDSFGASNGSRLVRLLPLPAGSEFDQKALANSDQHVWLSGANFHFLDLSPGDYAVGLSNWNEALFAQSVVSVGDDVVSVDLVVPEPDPNGHLAVRAFGPNGDLLGDLDFRWRSNSGKSSRTSGLQASRATDGGFWLKPKAEFFEPWGEDQSFSLSVKHELLGERVVQLSEGQREVELHFEEPVAVVVVVAGYAGSDMVGRLRAAIEEVDPDVTDSGGPLRRASRNDSKGQLDAAGMTRFDGLVPGRWRVNLLVEGGRYGGRIVQTREVEVRFGEEVVSLDLPILYELVVISSNQKEGGRITATPVEEGDGRSPFYMRFVNSTFDADGRAVLRDLTAGEYRLSGSGIRSSVVVTVPCGDFYLDDELPDSLRVSIGDLEGSLYVAGLRAGDLVVGADGVEFDSTPNSWGLLRGEGSISLMVERGTELVEFNVPKVPQGEDLMATLGGMFTAVTRP